MKNYPISQKLAIINAIDSESREVWTMLNDHAESYSQEDTKQLFISILNKDKDGFTRFDLKTCQAFIEQASIDFNGDKGTRNFDILNKCATATRKANLHKFLFDTADD